MAASLQGKIAIITGASSGIGAATVALFKEQGAIIAGLDIHPSTEPESPSYLHIICNITSEAECKAAVQQIVDKFGTIDYLCNVAGVADRFQGAATSEAAELQKVMGVNFYGPLWMIKSVLPVFLTKEVAPTETAPNPVTGEPVPVPPTKGVIVNVGSIASISGSVAGVAYVASKHALLGLSRNTVALYKDQGIRCNTLLPGGVATNIMAELIQDPAVMAGMGHPNIQRKMGLMSLPANAASMAQSILYLATGPYLNGTELLADNGWVAL